MTEGRATGASGFLLGRRELWLLLGFLFTVITLNFGLNHSAYAALVPQVHDGNQLQLLAHRLRAEREDVLIVGSSRTGAGVDPNLISSMLSEHPARSLEVVSLPIVGMRAWLLNKLVCEDLSKRPPSSLLVICLEARFFYLHADELDTPVGFQLLGAPGDLLRLNPMELSGPELKALTLSSLKGIQAPWVLLPRLLDHETMDYVQHLQEMRGYPDHDFRPGTIREQALVRAMRDQLAEREAREDETELAHLELVAFRKTLDTLEELPCQVAFVRLPVTKGYDAGQRTQLEQFEREVVASVIERGFEFHDLNEHAELRRPAYFKDPSHLNRDGREQASTQLLIDVISPVLLGSVPEFFIRTHFNRATELDEKYASQGASAQ